VIGEAGDDTAVEHAGELQEISTAIKRERDLARLDPHDARTDRAGVSGKRGNLPNQLLKISHIGWSQIE
jgi:hypothetical protein